MMFSKDTKTPINKITLDEALSNGGYYDVNGTWNSLIKKDDKILRERVETIVFNDHNQLYIRLYEDGGYRFPGGSTCKSVKDSKQALLECQQEAKIDTEEPVYTGISYIRIYDEIYNKGPLSWEGTLNKVFAAVYKSKYNGYVDKKDYDTDMYKNGKFVDITKSLYETLKPEHKKVLDVLLKSNQIQFSDKEQIEITNEYKTLLGRIKNNINGIYDKSSPYISADMTTMIFLDKSKKNKHRRIYNIKKYGNINIIEYKFKDKKYAFISLFIERAYQTGNTAGVIYYPIFSSKFDGKHILKDIIELYDDCYELYVHVPEPKFYKVLGIYGDKKNIIKFNKFLEEFSYVEKIPYADNGNIYILYRNSKKIHNTNESANSVTDKDYKSKGIEINEFSSDINEETLYPFYTPNEMKELGLDQISSGNDKIDIWKESYIESGLIDEHEWYGLLQEVYENKPDDFETAVFALGWNPDYMIEQDIVSKIGSETLSRYIDEQIVDISENYVFSKKDGVYNFDKWESGESNIFLITGLSGSGKSTLAEELADAYNAEIIRLDVFQCFNRVYTDKSFRQRKDVKMCMQYFKDNNIDINSIGRITDSSFEDIFVPFFYSVINELSKDKNKRYIVEGVHIMLFIPYMRISSYPLYCKNTSMTKSIVRHWMRDEWTFKDIITKGKPDISLYLDHEKVYNNFKSYLESSIIQEDTDIIGMITSK